MKKIYIICALTISSTTVLAAESDNILFQAMDNQIGIGYSYNRMHAYNPNNSDTTVNTNTSNLEMHIEELFASNVWFSLNGSFAVKANQNSASGNAGFNSGAQEFGFPATVGAKVGYSFNKSWADSGFQVIPYGTIGRTLNYNGVSVSQNTFTNSYLNQFGAGARLEYIFTPGASIYLDQSISYWQDPNDDTFNQSSVNYTTLLGIKYNVTDYFQIGLQGMFNQTNLVNNSGYDSFTYTYQNISQSTFGGMLNFAYLYDSDQLMSRLSSSSSNKPSSQAPNVNIAAFDNSYSIGYGMMNSTNKYSSGSLPNIDSSVSYFNFNITHLFENNVWADLNAQLLNSISQTNIQSGIVNAAVPTYIGFPGNITTDVGYGFQVANSGFQAIPYANLGMIMNMNSYNIRSNSGIMSAISQDRYLQYGLGVRLEYAFDNFWQIYGSQLIAGMNDQSTLDINAIRSTTTLGIKINPGSTLQFGLSGFYDMINAQGNPYSSITNSPVAANQNSIGGQFDIGIRY